MAMELHYTSVPRGLKPGSTGFCTVALTAGMPAPMIARLESLGGYRPIYDVGSPKESDNPPVCAHWRLNIGGHFYSVLSRIGFAGADANGRFNKYAHHVVLETAEQVPAGPAWVMLQPGVMEQKWSGEPRILSHGSRTIPNGSNPLKVCERWQVLAGDAGWAGMLAQALLLDASKASYVIYEPGMDMLALMNEAIALVPETMRWRVTFNTYFDILPAGLSCAWRCCSAGSAAAQAASANASSGVLIDLTAPPAMAPSNKFVQMARTGQPGAEAEPTARRIVVPAPERPSDFMRLADAGAQPPIAAPEPLRTPPSTSARSLEPAAAEGFQRRSRLLLTAAAILWPILVLGLGGLMLVQYTRNQTTTPGTSGPASTTGPQAPNSPKGQADIGKMVSDIRELNKVNEDLKQENQDLRDKNDHLTKDLAAATPNPKEPGPQNNDSPANAANTSEVTAKPPEQNAPPANAATPQGGGESADSAELKVVSLGGASIVTLPPMAERNPLMGTKPLRRNWHFLAPPNAALLKLRFANDLPPVLTLKGGKDKPANDARILLQAEGQKEPLEVASIVLGEHKIVGRWNGQNWPGAHVGKADSLQSAINYASIEFFDKENKPVARYQFYKPLVARAEKPQPLEVGEPLDSKIPADVPVEFDPPKDTGDWKVELGSPPTKATLTSAKTAGVIEVDLSPQDGHWVISSASKESNKPNEGNGAQDKLKSLEAEITNLGQSRDHAEARYKTCKETWEKYKKSPAEPKLEKVRENIKITVGKQSWSLADVEAKIADLERKRKVLHDQAKEQWDKARNKDADCPEAKQAQALDDQVKEVKNQLQPLNASLADAQNRDKPAFRRLQELKDEVQNHKDDEKNCNDSLNHLNDLKSQLEAKQKEKEKLKADEAALKKAATDAHTESPLDVVLKVVAKNSHAVLAVISVKRPKGGSQ